MEKVRQFFNENGWLYSSPYCLAVDEFHTHLGEAPRCAWSREGCPVEVSRPGQKISTYTVILCVRCVKEQAVVKYKLIKNVKKKIKDEKTGKVKIKKGTDTIDFYNFFEDFNSPTNDQYYLLLDNSSIHDPPNKRPSKVLREAGLLNMEELARQKNIVLKYLPEYSPQINPVELCIHFVRDYIENKQPRTEEKLREVLEEAVSLLNRLDLTQTFRHCRDYFFVVKNGK